MVFLRVFVLCLTVAASAWAEQPKKGFEEFVSDLNGYKAEVKKYEIEMDRLLQVKRRAHRDDLLKDAMRKIVETHEKFEKAVDTYHEQRARVRLKFPVKFGEIKGDLPYYRLKPLDQLMKEDGVPEKLDQLKAFMETQYGKRSIASDEIDDSSKGNIEGKLKENQTRLRRIQGEEEEWAYRPILEL